MVKRILRKIIKEITKIIISPFQRLRFKIYWNIYKNLKIDNINIFEKSIYSQNGEDGIIEVIFKKIGITNKYFVEFGTGNGKICNTRYLMKKCWNGLMMDSGNNNPPYIKKEFITAENINKLFKKYKVPKHFDLLSIDIDFNDYWVWKAIKNYKPRVVVIEYNSSINPKESRIVRYDPKRSWNGTNYFGASLLALKELGEKKGYVLIGCDNKGVNAFFIKNDLIKNKFKINDISDIYKPPKYGYKKKGVYIGHTPSKEKMIDI